ncbi:MAG: pantetheine-phosphate adenylyltransferase [Betaproteobacteria bacterium]|jgi:pantetheine-phosphate adenylyltransferase|nr:pantetheine-phosphate adenylyltransferase [Betaproteobacteria bacterium]NBT66591.1 pantetheine-phosphate adenylyltransferase [Betaproteobacteria bacterium]NBY08543.1 pantetheine-phosphate adenylyltransferase [Betaproteobacteria bacterium]
MTKPIIAIYPGTFDPITLGHEDIVRRASRLFDQVIIAVAEAHHKKTMFNLEERKTMTKEALKDCPNVVVESFTGLVSDFALAKGAQTMVRGVRSMTDFEYEFQLAGMNRRLVSHIDTVFLNTVDVYQCISSTLVREIAVLGGDVAQFVSPGVYARLQSKKA